MIEIIQDPDSLYSGYTDIVVDDTASYVKSRSIVDEVKNNIRENAVILISRPSYFQYYEDLYNISGWTKLTLYSINDVLSIYKLDFNDDEIRTIEKLIDKKELLNFLENYNSLLSFETNILNFVFENGKYINEITTNEEFILWMEKSLEKGRAEWKYYKHRNLLEDNISKNLDVEFVDRLLSIETTEGLQKIKECLVATYLFEKYSFSSKNIIKPKIELFDKIYVSEDYIKKIMYTYPEIIESINFILLTNRNKLSIFETENINEFLRLTKGYLNEEWNWVWDYLKSNYDYKSLGYIEILEEVYIWVNCDAKYSIEILLNLIKYNGEMKEYEIPKNIKQWYQYYENFYLKWFSQLDDSNNIIGLLNKINDGFLDTTINEIQTYKDNIEKLYKGYIYEQYPNLLKHGETNIKVINSISEYVDHNKILFFIIDGLRFELWHIVRNLFEGNQYFIENEWQYCLSMIPSITSISRTGLVAGKTFYSLMKEKEQLEFSFSILNEEKHIKKIYPSKSVVFKVGGFKDLRNFLDEKSDIYVFIYSEGDKIFHATEDLPIESIEPILQNLIDMIVDGMEAHSNMLIVFGTDHGSTKNHGTERAIINIPESVIEEQHGNSIKLYGDYFNQNILDGLKDSIDNKKFYTVWREDLKSYGLPKSTINKEVYGWIFPKHDYYFGMRPKGFNHGGFSMDETIIPYGIFRKQQTRFKELMIELTSINLKSDGMSHLDVVIYNPNNFGIKKIIIDVPSIDVREITNDLPAKGKRKIATRFKIDSSKYENNYFKETLSFNINYLNNEVNQYIKINEPVEIGVSEVISREISKKRTLDF